MLWSHTLCESLSATEKVRNRHFRYIDHASSFANTHSDLVQVETLRENGGRQIVKLRLCPLAVIKDLDVFRDLLLRLLPTGEPPTIGQLALQRAPK